MDKPQPKKSRRGPYNRKKYVKENDQYYNAVLNINTPKKILETKNKQGTCQVNNDETAPLPLCSLNDAVFADETLESEAELETEEYQSMGKALATNLKPLGY